MPAGGGDPHLITTANERFDFKGTPGEVYNLLQCHNLGLKCTVRTLPGDGGVQVIDRLIVHLPGDVNVVITPGLVSIDTPDHHLDAKPDPGHLVHEGGVYPDPLFGVGDAPHLDFKHTPKIVLRREHTTGLLLDGAAREFPKDEGLYRTGHFWAAEADF